MAGINGVGRVGIRNYVAPTATAYPSSLKLFIDAGNSLSYPGTGTTVTDLIGTQNGTLINGTSYNSANGGKFVFDGVNDSIDFGNNILQYTNFSTSVWVNVIDNNGYRVPIQNQYYNGSIGYFGWELYIMPTTNQCRIDLYNGTVGGGPDTLTSTVALSKFTWYHICFTKIAGGNLKIYINGILDSTKTSTTNNPVYHPSCSLKMGRQVDGAYPMYGSIPTAKIFNAALSSTEVLADFNEFKARYGYTNYTTRTTSFAAATGITDTTILNALNTFDTGLISNGLETKMKALYPFVGGTANTHKYNFMDARDLDVAYRLAFNGGWVHSANGALPNGTNAYANTFLTPSTTLTTMSQHISYYSRTNISTVGIGDLGVQDDLAVGASGALYAYYYGNSSQSAVCIQSNDANRIYFTETNSLGFLMGSRTSSTSMKAYRNNLLKGTNTATSTQGIASVPVWIGGFNYRNGSGVYTKYYGIREASFASIGDGLTDTDASNLYTLTQAFQTSLSRAV